MLFQVYEQYSKSNGVDINRLTNVDSAFRGGENSVVQTIQSIAAAHERSMEICPGLLPVDLLYHAALVYTVLIEELDDYSEIEGTAYKAQALFKEVLLQQVGEFQEFLGSFDAEPADREVVDTGVAEPEVQEYTSFKTVQPSDILDTAIAGLALAQAVLESVEQGELALAISFVAPFVQDLEAIALEVLSFEDLEKAEVIGTDQRNEWSIARASAQALALSSIDEVFSLWESTSLPDVPQRYMLAADSVESILDREPLLEENSADFWGSLTKMNNYLRKAQDHLNAEYQSKKGKEHLGLGSLIAQLSKVYIARSDIDLQRSQLPQAQQNSELLMKNAKAFLTNAMHLAKVAGGLRETALERAQREKRRIEAVARLCALEGKQTKEELDNIMGEGNWEEEWESYQKLWYFQRFFGN